MILPEDKFPHAILSESNPSPAPLALPVKVKWVAFRSTVFFFFSPGKWKGCLPSVVCLCMCWGKLAILSLAEEQTWQTEAVLLNWLNWAIHHRMLMMSALSFSHVAIFLSLSFSHPFFLSFSKQKCNYWIMWSKFAHSDDTVIKKHSLKIEDRSRFLLWYLLS